jgi:hypothetical protein
MVLVLPTVGLTRLTLSGLGRIHRAGLSATLPTHGAFRRSISVDILILVWISVTPRMNVCCFKSLSL